MRPENIAQEQTDKTDEQVTSRVDLVEPMGAEFYLYLTAGNDSYVARMTHFHKVELNEQIPLYFTMKTAHYFDAETEKALLFTD